MRFDSEEENKILGVKEWAKQYDDELECIDSRFDQIVLMRKNNGQDYVFMWAFCIGYGKHWVVFTEHNGYHIYKKKNVDVVFGLTEAELPEEFNIG